MAMTVFEHLAWIEDVPEPAADEINEDRTYAWGIELDREIAKLRVRDRKTNAGFLTAVTGGAGVLPISYTRVDGSRRINPLEALSRRGGDEDWIIVTKNRPDGDTSRFEDMARKLSPCTFETHVSPMWTIYICCHA